MKPYFCEPFLRSLYALCQEHGVECLSVGVVEMPLERRYLMLQVWVPVAEKSAEVPG